MLIILPYLLNLTEKTCTFLFFLANCPIENSYSIGDSTCNGVHNIEPCLFDGGDCCTGGDKYCRECSGASCLCHETGSNMCVGEENRALFSSIKDGQSIP